MLSFPRSSLLLTIFVALALVQGEIIRVKTPAQVVTSRPGQGSDKDKAGLVYGARSCGGKSKFLNWRIRDVCNTTDSPCQYPADGKVRNDEMTFIPRENVEKLGFRIISSINGSEPTVDADMPIENSAIEGGVDTTVYIPCSAPEEYKGSKYTGQNILYKISDGEIVMCAEADFDLV